MENEQNENNVVESETKNEQEEATKELPSIVQELKAQYEVQIEALKDAYGKQIAERDIVIKQLLSGDNTADNHETICDKINKKRNFKKW